MEYVYQDLKGPSGSSGSAGIPRDYSPYLVKSSAYTAHKGDHIMILSGADITLPSSPVAGDWVSFTMGTGVSAFLLRPNSGGKVNGLAGAAFITGSHTFTATYKDSTTGWVANPSAAGTTQQVQISGYYNQTSNDIEVNSHVSSVGVTEMGSNPYPCAFSNFTGQTEIYLDGNGERVGNDLVSVTIYLFVGSPITVPASDFTVTGGINYSGADYYIDAVWLNSSYGDLSNNVDSVAFRYRERTITFDPTTFPKGFPNVLQEKAGNPVVIIGSSAFNCYSNVTTEIALNPWYASPVSKIVSGATLVAEYTVGDILIFYYLTKLGISYDPIGSKSISGDVYFNDNVDGGTFTPIFKVDGTYVAFFNPSQLSGYQPIRVEVLDTQYNLLASYDGVSQYDGDYGDYLFVVDVKYGDMTGVFTDGTYIRYKLTTGLIKDVVYYEPSKIYVEGPYSENDVFADRQPVTLTY